MRQPIQVAVYCVRRNNNRWEYLLLRRNRSGGGIWQGVTGGVEGTEDCFSAALRELREETGFTPLNLRVMDYSYTFPVEASMRTLYQQPVNTITEIVFVAEIDDAKTPILDSREHDEYRWCAYDDAVQMVYWPGNRESLRHCAEYLRRR
jgi:dATP pyrophosphohydrolase